MCGRRSREWSLVADADYASVPGGPAAESRIPSASTRSGFAASITPIDAVASALWGAPWGAVSENGRLRQGTNGPARGHRRSKGLELTMLLCSSKGLELTMLMLLLS